MASKLKHIRSSVPGRVPTDAQLETGQIAINTADGKIFTKKDDGSIVALQAVDPDFASASIFQGDTALTIVDAQDSTAATITASIDSVPKVVIDANGTDFNGPININSAETLFFNDADNNKYVGIQAPDDVNFSYIIKLPPEEAIDPAVLQTDGNGNTVWGRPDAFGGNRVYVSDAYGDDANDGVNQPVKSITRATQIAADLSYRPKVDPGREFFNAKKLLRDNKPFIKEEAIAFIDANFVNYFPEFDQTLFGQDIDALIDAIAEDICFDTNYKTQVLAIELGERFSSFSTPGVQSKYIDLLEYTLTRIVATPTLAATTIQTITKLWNRMVEDMQREVADATLMSELYYTPNPGATQTLLNAFTLLQENKSFIAEEQIAWIEAEITAGNSPFQSGLTYNQNDWKDHYNDIIDALCYDLYYAGNSATINAADFIVNGNLNIQGSEPQFRESITHLITYIDEIIQSVTIAGPAQGVVAQYVDGSNAGSSTESALAVTKLTEFNERTYQDNVNYPVTIVNPAYVVGNNATPGNNDRQTLIAEKASIRQNSIIYLDAKYPGAFNEPKNRGNTSTIVDGLYYDVLLGTNYNQITYGLQYIKNYTTDYTRIYDNIQTVEAFKNAKTLVSGYTASDPTANFRANEAWDEIIYIIENGDTEDGSTRPMVYPSPVGVDTTRVESKDILQDKRVLIQLRALQFLSLNYPNITSFNTATIRKDIGYAIDALSYDILYQGNSATIDFAETYFPETGFRVPLTERAAMLDLYLNLKVWVEGAISGTDFQEPIDQEGNPINPDPTGTTATTPTTGATGTGTGTPPAGGGTPTAPAPTGPTGPTGGTVPTNPTEPLDPQLILKIEELKEKIDIIYAALDQGLSTLPNVLLPDVSWVAGSIDIAGTAIVNNKLNIQNSIISYIEDNFTGFTYNQTETNQEIADFLEAVKFDAVLGTNYNAVTQGLIWDSKANNYTKLRQRAKLITAYTRSKEETLSLVNVADTPAITSAVTTAWNEILDILENGPDGADTITFGTSAQTITAETNAKNQLQANRSFIQEEIVNWVTNNYPSLNYLQRKCRRDVGYLVDAISYDIVYGGNSASRRAAERYFFGTDQSYLPSDQRTATVQAYNRLSTVVSQVIQTTAVTPSAGNPLTQDTISWPAGTTTEAATAQDLIQITEDAITAGNTDNLPAETLPNITGEDADFLDAASDIDSNVSAIQTATTNYLLSYAFTYNRATCKRDVGLIVDAVAYDIVLGGNKKSVEGGLSYLSIPAVMDQQLFQTRKAIEFTRDLCVQGILNNVTFAPVYRNVSPFQEKYTNLSTITTQATVQERFDQLLLVLTRPAKINPDVVGISTKISSYNALQAAKEVIQTGTTRFIKGTFSGFIYNVTTCERDIGLIVDAVCYDLITGSNFASVVAGRSYLRGTANVVQTLQKDETIAAFGYARDLSLDYVDAVEQAEIQASWNIVIDIITNGAGAIPTSNFPDNNATTLDADTTADAFIANKGTYVTAVSNWLATNYPDLSYDVATCERDTGYLIDAVIHDLKYGGNAQTYIAADAYYSFGVLQLGSAAEKEPTIEAYNYLKNILIADSTGSAIETKITSLFADVEIIIREGDIPDIIEPRFNIIPITVSVSAGDFYINNPIIVPDFVTIVGDSIRSVVIRPLNSGKDMFRVRNGVYIFGMTFKDALDENNIPTYTFDFAVAFDDPQDTSIDRTEYFGIGNTKPIITTSPYIQNCSIISFLAANGVRVDGSKVTAPNIPLILEEVETPVSFGDGIPEQGKSMVSNAFTTLSFGGTGWLVINDAYAQIVSCFQIFMLNGSYCQSGGYLSITNSASNFGVYALRASGYSQNAFSFDRGHIVASGFDGGNTFTSIGTGRSPIEQFVLRIRDIADNTDITNNFKQATTEVTFNAATGVDPATNQITIVGHGFSNNQGVYYNSLGNPDIPGLLNQGQYFIQIIDNDTFRLFEDNSLAFAVDITGIGSGTHSFTLNAEEFTVQAIREEHNNYQQLILADGQGLNVNSFTIGDALIGDTSGFENTAYVYDWDHLTRTLIVSNEGTNVGAEDPITVRFEDTSTITQVAGAIIAPAYTIEAEGVTNLTEYWTATFTVDSTVPNNVIQTPSQAVGQKISFHRPSIVNSSSHTWEYSGSGIDYNALPQNGGNSRGIDFEQYSELPGRVYASGTNELGDFKVGSFIVAENKSGEITFNARVTVGELAVLRLSLSDVNIEEFSTDVGLGDNEIGGAKDERVSTQLAIRSFIANRLGNVLDKNVSANAVPGAVVQLNSAGQINSDLLPPARGITTYNVDTWEGRLELSNRVPPIEVIAGDNASETYQQVIIALNNNITANKNDEITQVGNAGAFGYLQETVISNTIITLADTTGTFNTTGEIQVNGVAQTGVIPSTVNSTEEIVDNYFMKSDTISQYLILEADVVYDFTGITEVIGANSGAQGDITAGPTYGIIASLNFATFNAGSGYTPNPGTATYRDVPLTGGTGTGAIGDITVTAGVVESVTLTNGGTGYAAGDTLSAAASNIGGTGTGFSINVATTQIRLFVDLTGGFVKFSASTGSPEYIQDANATVKTIADLTTTTNVLFNAADVGGGGDVDYLNSEFEITAHGLTSGEAVKYNRNANPVVGNLVDGQTYWVKVLNQDTFELYNNYGFTAGSQVLLGGASSGTHVFVHDTIAIDIDTIQIPAHSFQTGDIVRVSATDAPDGLLDETTYFVGSVTANSFTLHEQGGEALSSVNGQTINPVDLVDTGTGSATFTLQNVAIIGTVNTSSATLTNWGVLASSSFDASAIVSGVIDPSRLAPEGTATDQSFLRFLNGNSAWVLAVQNIRPVVNSPISVTGDFFTDPSDGLNKYYSELALDVARADDTGGDTNYTNLGVVGTNKLQFSTSNGQISIKSGVVDAGFLGGQAGNYYTNPNNLSASVPTNKGGTGLASYTAGDLIYSGATDSLTNLSIGPVNSVLFSDGNVPQWSTSPTFGGALTIAGVTAINSTNQATSDTTGALRVAGGVGIGGDIYQTGTINTEAINVINTDPANNVAMKVRSSLQFQAIDGIQQITARMDQPAGGLVFEGAAGQLLTITDTLVGTVFSVNNDTKTLIEGNDRNEVIMTPSSNSYTYVGQTSGNGVDKFEVTGNSRFTGSVNVTGSITAASKNFLINHPTKAGYKLQYGSLESPYAGVRLTGEATVVNGVVTVELPDYIHGLCRTEGATVHLTNVRHGQVLWVEKIDITNNSFEVRTDNTDGEFEFYWDFTAIRKDIPPLLTEYKY